jgi:hypothetical protein
VKGTAYQNVVIVAKSGGDFTTIQGALDSITDASSTNHYLVWVAPGTYTEQVTMKQYVDIEGAGELATEITYAGSAASGTGTLIGANNAEVRSLTVKNTGGNAYAKAIYNNSASPRLTNITASASGGTTSNAGVYNSNSSSPTMTNVTATGTNGIESYGVHNTNSSPTMTNITASASGATDLNYGAYNESSSPTMTNITASASGGTFSNTGVGNFSSSPTMTNVTASASGGTNNRGVYNSSSLPTMINVTASASGGVRNYGVYNNSSSSPPMTNVTASASGGTDVNWGVYNSSSSPTMINVTSSASGGANNYGVYNNSSSSPIIQNSAISASGTTGNRYGIANFAGNGSYTVKISNSQITGATNTIYNNAKFTVRVGASLLDGGPVVANGGTVTCAGVYDENYAFYPNTCP